VKVVLIKLVENLKRDLKKEIEAKNRLKQKKPAGSVSAAAPAVSAEERERARREAQKRVEESDFAHAQDLFGTVDDSAKSNTRNTQYTLHTVLNVLLVDCADWTV
jgi:hypothetical protein